MTRNGADLMEHVFTSLRHLVRELNEPDWVSIDIDIDPYSSAIVVRLQLRGPGR